MKKCRRCDTDKPFREFYKDSATPDGLGRLCRKCNNAQHFKWYHANLEQARLLARRSRLNNIDTVKARQKINYQRNRTERLKYANERSKRLKSAAYEAYGGYVCACCGESERAFLSLDHVNNDGFAHRRAALGKNYGASGLYMWLRKNGYPAGFQVLCMNCNYGKRMNGGVCPHKQYEKLTA